MSGRLQKCGKWKNECAEIFAANSWPWFAGMIPFFGLMLVMHPWVITGKWRLLPTAGSGGLLILNFLALTLAGFLLEFLPKWTGFLVAIAFGLFNGLLWKAVTKTFGEKEQPAFKLFAPVTIVIIWGGLLLGFHLFLSTGSGQKRANNPKVSPQTETAASNKIPLLQVQGLGTSWDGGPLADFGNEYRHEIFSYRGLNETGAPLPYNAADTREPLRRVVRTLEKQINVLAVTSKSHIRIVCASEGALATQIYLATHPDAPVDQVIIISPEIAPALVYFPPDGESGWGEIAGLGLHGWLSLFEIFGWHRPNQLPVLRSMLEYGPAISRVHRCPMGNFNETVLMPLSSSLAMPWDLTTDLPTYIVGTVHGQLVGNLAGNQAIRTVLARRTPQIPFWRTFVGWIGRSLGSTWRVPPLAPGLPAMWARLLAHHQT